MYKYRKEKRINAKNDLKRINEIPNEVYFIHYSCESFYDIKDGRTPRITSIAVKNMGTGQSISFSIHKIAEIEKVDLECIDQNYDLLEKKMLEEYFKFISDNSECTWIHWNMRDINFGFLAIEHRYKVLGGNPNYIIKNKNKIDLARLLTSLYGLNYIDHPRLEKLVDKNNITKTDFLKGKEEAEAFDNKEYIKLHRSTLRKVDIFESIITRLTTDSLKTNAKFLDIYGLSFDGIWDFKNNNWQGAVIFAIIGFILKVIVDYLKNNPLF